MKRCGICGTDIHMWQEGSCGPMVIDEQDSVVIGHESSGIVSMVGSGVTNLKLGRYLHVYENITM